MTFSPLTMNSGTWISLPVSRRAGLVPPLERSLDGGTTWVPYIKSDGSINGETLYGEGDLVAKSGFMYRLKVLSADFVSGTVLTGRFS